jgi:aspartyl-tRNA(Asn)/glutamyl-tRNA(Gln) amidotransferase subunit A
MWDVLNDAFTDFVSSYPDRISHETSVPPAGFADVPTWHHTVMAVEAAEYHRERIVRHPDDYPPKIAQLIEHGLRSSGPSYAEARAGQARLLAAVDASLGRFKYSAYLTPAATCPAPLADTTGDPAMNSPWSFLGLPTVSLPVAWSGHDGQPLPLSAQLTGRKLGEMGLLALAALFEATIGEFHPRLLPL